MSVIGSQVHPPGEEPTVSLDPARALAPDPALPAGSVIARRYTVLRVLGQGGMGVVLSAYDARLDRVVALYDAGQLEDGSLFLAMERVDGQTLRVWSDHRPWREVLAAYVQAGRGLAAAHAAGLIHRDFKPDNVLVGTDGRVRVTDFGLARATSLENSDPGWVDRDPPAASVRMETPHPLVTLTETGALLGTPAYMAPEQLVGKPAD